MTLRRVALLCAILGMVACGGQSAPDGVAAISGRTAIVNGTVVDGNGAEPINDGIVVLLEDRIEFVGRASDYAGPTPDQTIDAQGGTILPGIIDSHVHSAWDPSIRRRFLTDGVTSICDLGSSIGNIPRFDEDNLDQAPAARGFRAGPIITAVGGLPGAVLDPNLNYEVGTVEEARAAVVEVYNQGVDVIKVYLQREGGQDTYPMLSEEQLRAIVDQAHSLGLLVRAHVTYVALPEMAVQAGVDIVEHVPVHLEQSEAYVLSEFPWEDAFDSEDPTSMILDGLYPQQEAQLETMVEAGVIMVPTLHVLLGDIYRTSERTPEQEVLLLVELGIVRRFHDLGGVVGLGTDHDIGGGMEAEMPLGEMELLLVAGLAPMEVIEASTRVAAYVCGHGDELGTLEPGKLADVIVVDGDPLEDIQAMDRVTLVIRNGELAVMFEGMLVSEGWGGLD